MPFIFSFFFKGGISKYNQRFEDMSDQHVALAVYNLMSSLTTSLLVLWLKICCIITAWDRPVFVYHYKACWLINTNFFKRGT